MKNCTECTHANWKRTAGGKLHQSGDGMCGYEVKVPAIPACMYWSNMRPPQPFGGSINRRKPLNEHCVYWSKP